MANRKSHRLSEIRHVARVNLIDVIEANGVFTFVPTYEPMVVLLELSLDIVGFVINRHRTAELTRSSRGACVSAEWVLRFIRANSQIHSWRSNQERTAEHKPEPTRAGIKISVVSRDSNQSHLCEAVLALARVYDEPEKALQILKDNISLHPTEAVIDHWREILALHRSMAKKRGDGGNPVWILENELSSANASPPDMKSTWLDEMTATAHRSDSDWCNELNDYDTKDWSDYIDRGSTRDPGEGLE